MKTENIIITILIFLIAISLAIAFLRKIYFVLLKINRNLDYESAIYESVHDIQMTVLEIENHTKKQLKKKLISTKKNK